MTDRVNVTNLCLHGHHGVFPEETTLGQKFFIDISCETDFTRCTATDDHKKAVNYATLCELAKQVSDDGPYRLIETLADRIATAVLDRFAIVTEVTVNVRKPSAPLAYQQDHVGVELTRRRTRQVAFSFGSNVGDPRQNVGNAISYLQAEPGLHVDGVSQLYATAPWGKTDQDWFVNASATGWSDLAPLALLKICKRIEAQIGRVPNERWGPRVIDIDLLYADDLEIDTPELRLPHAELFNRAFVLIPLAEIAPHHVVLDREIGREAMRFRDAPSAVKPLDDTRA